MFRRWWYWQDNAVFSLYNPDVDIDASYESFELINLTQLLVRLVPTHKLPGLLARRILDLEGRK